MHTPYLLWERMEKKSGAHTLRFAFGVGFGFFGIWPGQDLRFFKPGRAHATDREAEREVQRAICSSRGGHAHRSRWPQPGAAPRDKQSGTRKAFSPFLSHACHKLHSPFIFLSTDRFK